MRLGPGVNTRPSLYSLSMHVAVSSLAARFVPSCCCLDGNRSNKLCVDVVNYVNFLDRSFEKGESDKRGINIAWRRHWSVVWAANDPSLFFSNHGEGLVESAFTFKTLLRHYAK